MTQENSLIHMITGKAELSDTKLEEWEALLRQYPAFGTGHLLLAKKLLQEKDTALPAAQQKAAIRRRVFSGKIAQFPFESLKT